MLEDISCLVSRALQSSAEQDNKWPYAQCRLETVVPKGKHPVPEDEGGSRRLSRVSKIMVEARNVDGIQSSPALEETNDQPGDKQQSSLALEELNDQSGDQQQSSPALEEPNDQPGDQKQSSPALEEPNDQPRDQQQLEPESDTGSLILPLGRDITINCLLYCSRGDYGSIASLNKSFRSLIRSGELYKLRRMNKLIEHWVYFSCQLLFWEGFDPVARRWMSLPKMDCKECFMCSDKESLAVGTQLLLFGKEIFAHVVYKYSILTNTWSPGKPMNVPRCLFGSGSVGHTAILAGGCDSKGSILNNVELYDSEKETWENLPGLNKERKMCSGVVMDGKFYVIGGVGGSDASLLTCAEEFDLETRTWKVIPDMSPVGTKAPRDDWMPPSAAAPPLVAVVKNQLYAADHADMEVRKYNKITGKWSTIGKLPERVDSMHGWGLAFRGCGDRLVVIGGPRSFGEGVIEVNSWVPDDGPPQWELLGRKRLASFVYNCAVMGC